MTNLKPYESCYFIVSMVIALTLIALAIIKWNTPEPNCWNQYQTETQAIQECEKP